MTEGNYLVSFAFSGATYTFPTVQSQLRDNFLNVVPRTTRMAGVDGGFDQFGRQKAPKEIGNVTVTFTLVSETRDGMDALRDQVRVMSGWGVGVLTKRFGASGTRFCLARINSIDMSEVPNANTDLQQPVTINFQVASPYWLTTATWGAGQVLTQSVAGTNDYVVPHVGNFESFPRITVARGAGSASNFTIARRVGGVSVDSFSLNNFTAGQSPFIFNIHENRIESGSASTVITNLTWNRAGVLRLLPGDNTIRVSSSGVPVTVTIEAYGRW